MVGFCRDGCAKGLDRGLSSARSRERRGGPYRLSVRSLGDFLVEPVEIGVVSSLLRLHKAMVGSLSTGAELSTLKEPVTILCQSYNLRRIRLMAFDRAL